MALLEILRAYANIYVRCMGSIAQAGWKLRNDPSGLNDDLIVTAIGMACQPLMEDSELLPMTAKQALRIIELLANPGIRTILRTSAQGMAERLVELQSRLEDELETKLFFVLPHEKRMFFDTPRKGWEEVIARFPDTIPDVEEMSKCFALSRYPAAVFHSVNAIEAVLIDFGKFLNVADPKSGWTAVSGKLATLVTKTKYQDLDPLYQKHFSFLEQVHGTVEALKSAWRNKISHAQGRLFLMGSEFSPDVAEEIMLASRRFMRRLATEMP